MFLRFLKLVLKLYFGCLVFFILTGLMSDRFTLVQGLYLVVSLECRQAFRKLNWVASNPEFAPLSPLINIFNSPTGTDQKTQLEVDDNYNEKWWFPFKNKIEELQKKVDALEKENEQLKKENQNLKDQNRPWIVINNNSNSTINIFNIINNN